MQFDVDVEKLLDAGLDINGYLFCRFIYNQDKKIFEYYLEQFDKFFSRESLIELINKGLLELEDNKKGFIFSNILVTDLFIKLFIEEDETPKQLNMKKAKPTKELEWFDEWYSLWPRGIKSGGYPVKGDRKGCIKKLTNFVNNNPEFEKEIIIKATKDYIDNARMNRYSYMKLAHFFIMKDNVSALASYCEIIKDKIDNGSYKENNGIDYDRINDI